MKRLLADNYEVVKYDYGISVEEDKSVKIVDKNKWNDVFDGFSYAFIGINLFLICLLFALIKRW